MAKSETSFPQRLQKVKRLVIAAASFTPAYEPADSGLLLPAVTAAIANAAPLNDAVATAITESSAVVQERVAQIILIKARATLLLNYIKSNPAWLPSFARAKILADAVRDMRPKSQAPLPQPRSTQSYSDVAQNWRSLIALAIGLPGFSPPVSNPYLQPAALTATLTPLTTLNAAAAANEETLSTLRQQRVEAYDGPGGLQEKFKGLKQAIRGQYGHTSIQFKQVKGLGW